MAAAIHKNWPALRKHCKRSPFSLTAWTFDENGDRALKASVEFDDRITHRMRVRANSSYILRADIARCFPSIYTHSVAWALLGKAKAKKNYSDSKLGNLLDVLLQSMQDGQTIGIPIGQDTSRLVSELILSDIDAKLAKGQKLNGIRAIDDYEFGFRTMAAAESFLARLQRELEGYELALNPLKTRIDPLPQPLLDEWESQLRMAELAIFTPIPDLAQRRRRAILYFHKALELQRAYPQEGVLRLALARSGQLITGSRDWEVYQHFLLQCATSEAGTLPSVIDKLLVAEVTSSLRLDRRAIAETFNHLIAINAPLGHSSEVAFAIWGCMLFSLKIDSTAAKAISAMEDATVAVMALDAHSKGLIPAGLRRVSYRRYFREEELYGGSWLLAYEAAVHGWLAPGIASSYVDAEPCFGHLKAKGVRFYDPNHAQEYRNSFSNATTAVARTSLYP